MKEMGGASHDAAESTKRRSHHLFIVPICHVERVRKDQARNDGMGLSKRFGCITEYCCSGREGALFLAASTLSLCALTLSPASLNCCQVSEKS